MLRVFHGLLSLFPRSWSLTASLRHSARPPRLRSLSLLATYAHTLTRSKYKRLVANCLSSLTVRSKLVDFDDPDSWERNMDDLILKAAIWQDEHWVDCSAFLKVEQSSEHTKGAAKVIMLSLDHNRAYLAFSPFQLLSDPLLLHQSVSKHVRDTWTLPVKKDSLFCWPRRTDGNDRSSSVWSSRQWCCASVLGEA